MEPTPAYQIPTHTANAAAFAPLLGTSAAMPAGLTPDTIIGTPYQDINQWDGMQTAPDDCAIRAQQFIIEQFTGQKLDEHALEQEAQTNGWYDPGHGGTPLADMGDLLQSHGIKVDTYQHATVTQLANELAQGHKVIIGVNAENLWSHDPAQQGIVQASGSQGADHAVVVSGIDTRDPNNIRVIVSDPGTGEATASYPMNDFLSAWKASDFTMVATHDPAPSSLPEMTNFDYTTGHLPDVMGVPYDQFTALETQPELWTQLFAQPSAGPETAYPTAASDAEAGLPPYATFNGPETTYPGSASGMDGGFPHDASALDHNALYAYEHAYQLDLPWTETDY